MGEIRAFPISTHLSHPVAAGHSFPRSQQFNTHTTTIDHSGIHRRFLSPNDK